MDRKWITDKMTNMLKQVFIKYHLELNKLSSSWPLNIKILIASREMDDASKKRIFPRNGQIEIEGTRMRG